MLTVRRQRPIEERPDARLVADQDDVHVGVRRRPVDGAADDLLGGVVAAHGIDRDAGPRQGTVALVTLQRRLVHACLSVPGPVPR